jgi:hypothetical protein
MTRLLAQVMIEKRGCQYQVSVQIRTKYRGCVHDDSAHAENLNPLVTNVIAIIIWILFFLVEQPSGGLTVFEKLQQARDADTDQPGHVGKLGPQRLPGVPNRGA